VAKKSLIYSLFCSIYGAGIWGDGVGWKRHGGKGLAENVRIPLYRGERV